MHVLVTGGAGFIGSHFVRGLLTGDYRLAERPPTSVTVLDKLTYAGNLASLADVADDPRYSFVHGDIRDPALVDRLVTDADAVVMAAAVADFRPDTVAAGKIKKTGSRPAPISLVENPDILAGLVASRDAEGSVQTIVGFAAETGDTTGGVLDHGRAKLAAKGCDLLVVNEVGPDVGFEVEDNEAVVLGADGSTTPVPRGPKAVLAHVVWDLVTERFGVG